MFKGRAPPGCGAKGEANAAETLISSAQYLAEAEIFEKMSRIGFQRHGHRLLSASSAPLF
jgi:hypothetical protein